MKRLSVLLSLLYFVWLHVSTVVGTSGCVKGLSPINIVTNQVSKSTMLNALVFNSDWKSDLKNGIFAWRDGNFTFTPPNGSNITITTFAGDYQLSQVNFRWGSDDKGSEHELNGRLSAMEIQFIHNRINNNGSTCGKTAVIAVLANANGTDLGMWDPLQIDSFERNNTVTIKKWNLNNLLPTERDYYYYSGSVYNNVTDANWFILKEKINVPEGIFIPLRMSVTRSSRIKATEEINSRVVMTTASSVGVTSLSLMAILSIALLVTAGLN